MNITEYKLTITDETRIKTLTYRGNENIIITSDNNEFDEDDGSMQINFPRNVLEKFIEMINE